MTEKSISAEELEQRYADATVSNALTNEDAQELPPELQDFVDKLFELARTGTVPPGEPSAAEQLAGYVAAGLNPNLTNHEGNTLLMLAAYNGHADIVTALAQHGADVDRLNDRGPIAARRRDFQTGNRRDRGVVGGWGRPAGRASDRH